MSQIYELIGRWWSSSFGAATGREIRTAAAVSVGVAAVAIGAYLATRDEDEDA